MGVHLESYPLSLGIQGFHLEFVPFQLHFPNVVIPLGHQQFEAMSRRLSAAQPRVEKRQRISRKLRRIIFIPDSWLADYKRHYVRFWEMNHP